MVSMSNRRILVVDDEKSLCDYLAILLRRESFAVEVATEVPEAIDKLSRSRYDVILSDLMIGTRSGLEIVQAVASGGPPVVLMTAFGTVEKAVEALRMGARDFIVKPFQNEVLVDSIRRAMDQAETTSKNTPKPRTSYSSGGDDNLEQDLVGKSARIIQMREILRRVAPSESTILITGESGTGKEVVARAIHRLSIRAGKAFLPIHCAALSESLLESELFGHVKGAFTGATNDSAGLFVAAKGGTVFLDEIGEIPPSIQVKLLRVLQEREVTPVGGVQATPIDVRIVAATNADLEKMVQRGTFREDLYYRLNVIRLLTPPLRDRQEDLGPLATTLLERISRRLQREPIALAPEAVAHLATHNWPGNIRELENTLERSAVLCPRQILEPSDLALGAQTRVSTLPASMSPSLEAVQKAYIYWVLVQNQWRQPQAAAILGIDPTRLQRMIEHYGLQDSSAHAD